MTKDSDCIFCKIAKKEIKSEFIEENNNFIAIRDIHPKAEGHTLIIPKKHFFTFLYIFIFSSSLISQIKDRFKNLNYIIIL